MKPIEELVEQMGREAEATLEAVRAEELGRIAGALERWLGLDPEERLSEVDVIASLRAGASRATGEARATPGDLALEVRRRVRWRAVFQVAEALGLDPFGRTPEQVVAREGPELERSWRRCEGRRKDGQACRGWAQSGARFCYQHQPKAAREEEAVTEEAMALEGDAERRFFEEAGRVLGGSPGATMEREV